MRRAGSEGRPGAQLLLRCMHARAAVSTAPSWAHRRWAEARGRRLATIQAVTGGDGGPGGDHGCELGRQEGLGVRDPIPIPCAVSTDAPFRRAVLRAEHSTLYPVVVVVVPLSLLITHKQVLGSTKPTTRTEMEHVVVFIDRKLALLEIKPTLPKGGHSSVFIRDNNSP